MLLLIQSSEKSDPLRWIFTLAVALFPALVLTAFLVVFYFLVVFIVSKNNVIETDELKNKIFSTFSILFVLATFFVIFKWEYWSSINLLIPFLISGFLYFRKAIQIKKNSQITKINRILIIIAFAVGVVSVIYYSF